MPYYSFLDPLQKNEMTLWVGPPSLPLLCRMHFRYLPTSSIWLKYYYSVFNYLLISKDILVVKFPSRIDKVESNLKFLSNQKFLRSLSYIASKMYCCLALPYRGNSGERELLGTQIGFLKFDIWMQRVSRNTWNKCRKIDNNKNENKTKRGRDYSSQKGLSSEIKPKR